MMAERLNKNSVVRESIFKKQQVWERENRRERKRDKASEWQERKTLPRAENLQRALEVVDKSH